MPVAGTRPVGSGQVELETTARPGAQAVLIEISLAADGAVVRTGEDYLKCCQLFKQQQLALSTEQASRFMTERFV